MDIIRYEDLERRFGANNRVRKTIEGSKVGCSKCVGYCNFEDHRGYLTAELRKRHDCINKGCRYYVVKNTRKDVSTRSYPFSSLMASVKDDKHMILEKTRRLCEKYEGLAITEVNMRTFNAYTVSYVTITNAYDIKEISRTLSRETGKEILMDRVNCDFEIAARIIFGKDIA